jgi:hypothetical protein
VKWLYSSLLCLSFFSTVAHSQEAVKPFNWNLFGSTEDGINGYYDTNIRVLDSSNRHDVIEAVDILIVFPSPKTIHTKLGDKTINSIVAEVVMDCDRGNLVPVMLFSYTEEIPTKEDQPIAQYEYDTDKIESLHYEKMSRTYKYLCPMYV